MKATTFSFALLAVLGNVMAQGDTTTVTNVAPSPVGPGTSSISTLLPTPPTAGPSFTLSSGTFSSDFSSLFPSGTTTFVTTTDSAGSSVTSPTTSSATTPPTSSDTSTSPTSSDTASASSTGASLSNHKGLNSFTAGSGLQLVVVGAGVVLGGLLL